MGDTSREQLYDIDRAFSSLSGIVQEIVHSFIQSFIHSFIQGLFREH
jgi:hypothetical protein